MNLRAFLKISLLSVALLACLSEAPAAPLSASKLVELPAQLRHQNSQLPSKNTYRDLRTAAFDSKKNYSQRWKSLVSMAWVGQRLSIPDLELALKSSDWFMRDAGLRCLAKIDPAKAKTWGRRLLNDKALVVRTTAVQTLHELQDRDSLPLLWGRLQGSENFRHGKSLWVRKHMVRALEDLNPRPEVHRFAELLRDRDPQIRTMAQGILQRKTGLNYQTTDQWLKWAANITSRPSAKPSAVR